MNFEIALTKDAFRETLMNIIEESKLNDSQEETFKGLLHLEGELNVENEDLFCKDVDYSLNLCIKLLKEIETVEPLSKEDKGDFDDICNRTLGAEALKKPNIKIGKMVVYEGLAYQIIEIDYDEFSVCLSDGGSTSNAIYVSPTSII